MQVLEVMNRDVVTVKSNETIKLAILKAAQYQVRHLPVIENGKLVGIVSNRDLRDASPSILDSHEESKQITNQPVSMIMHKHVITVHPFDFVDEAALLLYENRIGCLPVIEGGSLVGIITETDIMYSLITLIGVYYPSMHIRLEVDNKEGILTEVISAFKDEEANIYSVLVFPGNNAAKKNIVIRLRTKDLKIIIDRLKEGGYSVLWPSEICAQKQSG